MATYARSHGGDGGGRDPHDNSRRLPTDCESSASKKVRGRVETSICLRLTGRMAISHSHWSLIHLPRHTSLSVNTDDGLSDKSQVLSRKSQHTILVGKKFLGRIKTPYFAIFIIHDDCARRYRDRKSSLKKHFEAVGGYEDVEEAKTHPHESISSSNWKSLIDDLFLNVGYMARSIQYSSNRAKQPYANTSGSKSFAQWRYEEVQKSGRANLIDGWRRMHTSHGTWVNDRAQNDWNSIQEKLTRMQQACEEVDEEEVLRRALGERRGWSRGVGRKVINIPANVSSLSESQFNELKEQIRQLNETVKQMQGDGS